MTFDAENVSQGGILLRAAVRLAPGSAINLELALPPGFVPLGPRTLLLRGEVVRAESHEEGHTSLAVAFLDLDDAVEEALSKYVRRKSILGRP